MMASGLCELELKMKKKTYIPALFLLMGTAISSPVLAADHLPPVMPVVENPGLIDAAQGNHIWNGVAVTHNGRIFVSLTQTEGAGLQLAEVKNNELIALPDKEWNTWKKDTDPSKHFLHVNAVRIGPDGNIWAVDAGNTGIGTGAVSVPGAAKLVKIDIHTGKVLRVYQFPSNVQKPSSYVDDVRFNGNVAYLSDPGAVGLIVLDLNTGQSHRVLENIPLAIDHAPIYADGKKLILPNGEEKRVGIDQMEVSPDGKYLYFQAIPGPLARIETKYLNDSSLDAKTVNSHAVLWHETWSTAGTAIDSDGNIYLSEINDRTIKKISPDKKVSVVIADPRLVWVDAMWIQDGYLWMPTGQINRTPATTGGKPSTVEYPVHLYKLKIDKNSPVIDHR